VLNQEIADLKKYQNIELAQLNVKLIEYEERNMILEAKIRTLNVDYSVSVNTGVQATVPCLDSWTQIKRPSTLETSSCRS